MEEQYSVAPKVAHRKWSSKNQLMMMIYEILWIINYFDYEDIINIIIIIFLLLIIILLLIIKYKIKLNIL